MTHSFTIGYIVYLLRGETFNDEEKHLQVRNLLRGWRVDVICPQETKMGIDEQQICAEHQVKYICGLVTSCISRGLLKWDKRVIEKVFEAVGEHIVSCKFQNVADGFEWVLQGCIDLLMI